ncbi:MAG: GDSL-type esterase/lipase family protein [Alistipes shahii]|uniref:GDSL-type esterase/lipase family protein n=1 Tax=Alistipes shahii TaxID=328814 RepID=UPI00399D321F
MRPSCWPRGSNAGRIPYWYRNAPRANRAARRSAASKPTGHCFRFPHPAHATSNSSATRTPAATAPRANRSRSPLRPRPRTAIWRGDASSPAISTPNTPSSPTRDRASSATGATKRRSPTAPCANACSAPSTWTPASRWDFRGCTPDIVVIKLGSNDFSTGVTPSEQAFNASYAQALDQLRAAYGQVPVLCVAPSDNLVILRYLENFLRERQDAHLHLTAMLPGITDWDRDMGANYHPNHRGHRKMAMAVIPYIATITGWEMPDRNVE